MAGGVLARLVGRGWRNWLVFTAAILVTAAVKTFAEVYAASLLHRVLGSLLVFGVLAIPASIGWSLTAVVTRVLTTPGGIPREMPGWRKTTWALVIWSGIWAVVVTWWTWIYTEAVVAPNVGVFVWLLGAVILAIPWYIGRRRVSQRR